MKLVIAFAVSVLCGFATLASGWTYDSTAMTIDDGDWTFTVTKAEDTDLSIGACSKYPETPSLLDFSKPVTDGETTYDIVALNTAMGVLGDGYGHSCSTTSAGVVVCELRLPDNGKLATIGAGAFARLDNCTKITPFIPDSVTTVGISAFWCCKAAQDLRLYGLTAANYSIFYNSSITSVTFGPNLKTIASAYEAGSFNKCSSLTNITFDAEMSGASFSPVVAGPAFHNCSALKGTLDLRGFSKLNYCAFNGTSYDTILFGEGLTELISDAFQGMTKLGTVKFYGAPPKTLGTPVYNTLAASQIIATYVMSEDESVRAEWAKLTADGTLNKSTSTWHANYVVSGSAGNRYLVLPDEGGGGETGFWVFDDNTKKLASKDGKWEFSASRSFVKMTIGSCTKWPSAVDELDFSKSITTADGTALILYELNTAFATTPGQSGWDYFANGNPKITEAAQYVGRVVLPSEGLEIVDRGAFAGCTALTNVVNYLPDTVSYLGCGAFFKVPAAQDVRLYNIPRVDYHAFGYAGLTSITFGPKLKFLRGFYANGTFINCKALTNVTFDAGMSGATIDSSSDGVFAGCTALTGRLDLRGFTDLGVSLNIGSSKLQEFVIADAVKSLPKSYFNSSYVTNVIFLGRPPLTIETPYLNGGSAKKTITTTLDKEYLKATNSAGKCWRDYAANNRIYETHTTWATNYVAAGIDLKYRPLVAPGAKAGFVILIN